MKWFLVDCVIQLLEMGNETSTQEFLNSIHKDPDLSLIHIIAVKEKCVKNKVIDIAYFIIFVMEINDIFKIVF